jgi:hypothetical protein
MKMFVLLDGAFIMVFSFISYSTLNDRMIMNDDSERIWKEVVMTYYKELLQYLCDELRRTMIKMLGH